MRKVIIYCRVSHPKQTIYGMSLEDQEYRLVEFCNQRGWQIVEIIHETYPAKTFKDRKKISRILKEARSTSCRFDTILCISMDRFTRHVASAEETMEILMDSRVEFHTLDKRYNLYTVTGRREYSNDAFRAQDDNMNRASKAESGVKHRIRSGESPFRVGNGYKKILGNKHKDPLKRTASKVVFDESTVHIYQEAFIKIANGIYSGEGAWKYIRDTYGIGIKKNTFYNILKNPYYMGYLQYSNDEGEKVMVKGNHPPMVSESVWYTVQEKLAFRKRKVLKYKKRNADFPLKGFLICPSCGRKLTAGKSKSGTTGYHYYYNCQRKVQKCTFNMKSGDAHELFSSFLNSHNVPQNVISAYKIVLRSTFEMDDAARNNKIDELKSLIAQGKETEIETLEFYVAKKINDNQFEMLNNKQKKEITEITEELERLQAIESSYSKYIRTNKCLLHNINEFFWKASVDCQSEILDVILETAMKMDKQSIVSMDINPNFSLLLKSNKEEFNEQEGGDIQ